MTEQTEQVEQAQQNRNPYTLWFVILSFAAPVVVAYYMFFFGDISSFSNNGEFITPYYKLDELGLSRDGEAFGDEDALDQKWHVMMVAGASCDEVCRQRMINLRQISRAVKRPVKIRNAVILTAEPGESFRQFLDTEMSQDTVMLQAGDGTLAVRMPLEGEVSQMYLVDPRAFVVMRFGHELDPKLVIKDLNRLF